ncbi:hypothetical protein [Nocardia seriolae]|uniref:hypothetical protein n=1 Tax=Nocardia seriolae TaxID=37332 RepID=UPI001314D63A|nr:hypothetical protein [Nocardia seriolae]
MATSAAVTSSAAIMIPAVRQGFSPTACCHQLAARAPRSCHGGCAPLRLIRPGAASAAITTSGIRTTSAAKPISAMEASAPVWLSPVRRRKRSRSSSEAAGTNPMAGTASCRANSCRAEVSAGMDPRSMKTEVGQSARVASAATISQRGSAPARACSPASTALRCQTAAAAIATVKTMVGNAFLAAADFVGAAAVGSAVTSAAAVGSAFLAAAGTAAICPLLR